MKAVRPPGLRGEVPHDLRIGTQLPKITVEIARIAAEHRERGLSPPRFVSRDGDIPPIMAAHGSPASWVYCRTQPGIVLKRRLAHSHTGRSHASTPPWHVAAPAIGVAERQHERRVSKRKAHMALQLEVNIEPDLMLPTVNMRAIHHGRE